MINDFLIPFLVVGLAELGDKTQLTIFCLASKTKKHIDLLLGVMLAFAIADGLAIIFGDFITFLLLIEHIKIGAGIIFIMFGAVTLIKNQKPEKSNVQLKNPFLSGFGLILISEIGDKTQISAGLFATKFNPIIVFIGVIAVLAILSVMAVYFGNIAVKKINKKILSNISGIIFVLIGIASLFS